MTFLETNVRITTEGRRYLGAAIGRNSFKEKFVQEKVHEWIEELLQLTEIARTKPQAAYSAFTHGTLSKWTYLIRTICQFQQKH